MSVEIHLTADCGCDVEAEAGTMDWGALVTSHQGGVEVFVVGLSAKDASALLRDAADVLAATE